jgi:periplasmic protein TonB
MMPEGLHSGLPPSSDRMMTTLFLAALLHGIVILGVGFSSGSSADDSAPLALEVVLVGDQAPAARDNRHAKYLAERSQRGAGNAREGRARIPKSSPVKAEQAGQAEGDLAARQALGDGEGADQLLASRSRSTRILYFANQRTASAENQMPLLLEARPNLGMTETDDGVELRMKGEQKNQLWIAADTQESSLAVYLDTWRRKVERIGTLNFPGAARQGLTGTPVIEVTIGANGHLVDAAIRRSSGHAELDQAALRILKLAAPYEGFPKQLSVDHDEIRFAYEWQFLDGAAGGSSVYYADPALATKAPAAVQ